MKNGFNNQLNGYTLRETSSGIVIAEHKMIIPSSAFIISETKRVTLDDKNTTIGKDGIIHLSPEMCLEICSL